MCTNTYSILKGFYARNNPEKTLVIDGYEDLHLPCKQVPWPELPRMRNIEIAMPLGGSYCQPRQVQRVMQSPISFSEPTAGAMDEALESLLVNGVRFNAWIYEGTPKQYSLRKRIRNCFLQMNMNERSCSNGTKPKMFSGTLIYHYLGEMEEGMPRTNNSY